MQGYNPYRNYNSLTNQNVPDYVKNNNYAKRNRSLLGNRTLVNLSLFGRNYNEYVYKNARTRHPRESINSGSFSYTYMKEKLNALSSDGVNTASSQMNYHYKLNLFRRYAQEPQINNYVRKMANEIISYSKKKKFCRLINLDSEKYSTSVIERAQTLFDEVYKMLGFDVQSRGYDVCVDFLVEGYVSYEIVYNDSRTNIEGFQKIDPTSIIRIIDEETGIKLWVQDAETNPRVILDSDIIYIAYSGSSEYSHTSYIEPMIRPYNELKGLERTKILFNIINSTMHKSINVNMSAIPKHLQEQELFSLMSMYKDYVTYDNYEGITYINGEKDLPYSKEKWFINNGDGGVDVETEAYNGNDINEDITLNWFRNNFKESTGFPLTRLDQSSGGGSLYLFGSDVTLDDYNFDKRIELIRTQFSDILIKPVYNQLVLENPELLDSDLYSDLELEYYGNDEILNAKRLNTLQAKVQIAAELTNNFKQLDGETPYIHPRLIAEEMFDDDFIKRNDNYWKLYPNVGETEDGGGGGVDFGGVGNDDIGIDTDIDLDDDDDE